MDCVQTPETAKLVLLWKLKQPMLVKDLKKQSISQEIAKKFKSKSDHFDQLDLFNQLDQLGHFDQLDQLGEFDQPGSIYQLGELDQLG